MLELLYRTTEENGQEAKSVDDFYGQFITTEEAENKFYNAIRDSRFIGFKAGFAAALALFVETAR